MTKNKTYIVIATLLLLISCKAKQVTKTEDTEKVEVQNDTTSNLPNDIKDKNETTAFDFDVYLDSIENLMIENKDYFIDSLKSGEITQTIENETYTYVIAEDLPDYFYKVFNGVHFYYSYDNKYPTAKPSLHAKYKNKSYSMTLSFTELYSKMNYEKGQFLNERIAIAIYIYKDMNNNIYMAPDEYQLLTNNVEIKTEYNKGVQYNYYYECVNSGVKYLYYISIDNDILKGWLLIKDDTILDGAIIM